MVQIRIFESIVSGCVWGENWDNPEEKLPHTRAKHAQLQES